MSGPYIVVSDIHGVPKRVSRLLSLLHSRGWKVAFSPDGHPVLHHDNETLILAGDSSDRGMLSVPFSYFMASSWSQAKYTGVRESVVTLMGNHDDRIKRWAEEGFSHPSHGFNLTYNQLNDPWYKTQTQLLVETIPQYNLWYEGDNFIAVHASWQEPQPTYDYAIRGPYIDYGDVKINIDWWETETFRKPIIFGHYHAMGDMLFPKRGLYCVDNHDADIFTYAHVDEHGVTIKVWNEQYQNPLMHVMIDLVK